MGQRRVRALVEGYTFVGNTEAGEILGIPSASNVAKALKRHGVEKQTLRVGKTVAAVYPIDDIYRLREEREAKA
jgi:hypothetical protein